jgi:dTDP-4-dehydrorhamnose reductase
VEDAKDKMTNVIIGANGQLGSAFRAIFAEKQIEYVSVTRDQIDITDETQVASYVSDLSPSIIFNCAAWTDVDGAEVNEAGAEDLNIRTVKYLAKAAKAANANFVHISSDYVFSGESNVPWEVYSERSPKSVYGKTKALGEDLLIGEFANISRIYRTSWLYSRFGHNFAKSIIRAALKDENDIKVVVDQIGQPTSAVELAEIIIESVKADVPMGIYHATNSGSVTWYDFAREIVILLGANPERVKPISTAMLNRRASRPGYSVLSNQCWDLTSVKPMDAWEIALKREFPHILLSLQNEDKR